MGDQEDIAYLVEIPGYDGWSVKVLTDGTKINRWQNVLDRWEREGARFVLTPGDWAVMRRRAERAQAWIEDNS